eukprot:scaffold178970_cov32-Prasinocladus_malaysianus.AAC.1
MPPEAASTMWRKNPGLSDMSLTPLRLSGRAMKESWQTLTERVKRKLLLSFSGSSAECGSASL